MSPYDSDKVSVIIKHFNDSVDAYGQRHTECTTSSGMMALYKCRNDLFSDPRFNNVELLGLSDRDDISDNDHIIYKDKEYKVIYSILANEYDNNFDNCYYLEIYE